MTTAIIYHNPKCSKSRQTLAILQEKCVDVKVIEYLKMPPRVPELRCLSEMLGLAAKDFIRKKEQLYKDLKLNHNDISDAKLLQAMHNNPLLIERPIVVIGNKAVLARPPENVLQLL